MTFCYDSFMLFEHICTFSHNRVIVKTLQQGGIFDSGYFSYHFLRGKGRSKSAKVTRHSIFTDSAAILRLPQDIWNDIVSDTVAELCETL